MPESYARKYSRGFKGVAKWALGTFIKGQIGSILGGIFSTLMPGLAISGALLIASFALYIAISNPGTEAIAPMILGLAMGVIG